LVPAQRVLDGEGVQAKRFADPCELVGVRFVQPDPHEGSRIVAGVQRLFERKRAG
jgi:hypothetical protein